jgi:hypothetical protein
MHGILYIQGIRIGITNGLLYSTLLYDRLVRMGCVVRKNKGRGEGRGRGKKDPSIISFFVGKGIKYIGGSRIWVGSRSRSWAMFDKHGAYKRIVEGKVYIIAREYKGIRPKGTVGKWLRGLLHLPKEARLYE